MTNLPENFCVAPFLQLTTHPSGSFSPCPYLGGTTWKGQYSSIVEAWKSQDLELLRSEFLHNQKSSICKRCWHEEKNNKKSLRLRLYDPINGTSDFSIINAGNIVQEMINGIEEKLYIQGPKILTIKNGNVCNAKCRSCHPADSSRWNEDAKQLKIKLGKQYYTVGQEEKNWTDSQLDEIFDLSKSFNRLELFGGEPLYNKKVHRLLNRIIDAGHSKNINLYINTNGSVDLVSRIPQIKEFKEIEIGVSLDGVESQFEYLRHGLTYQEVIKNICIWQNFFEQHQVKYYIDSISTVSVFNILYLPEIKKAVMEVLPQSPFWNLLVDPEYLCIKNMPDLLKEHAINLLKSDPEFEELINVIQQPADPAAWGKFLEITPTLDNIRGEDFREIFPELAKFIK
jgi:MoaA/NifB/PqqE/SkfB family radical SAM enzyme